MAQKFEFRGDLAETPLPEVLETINRYRVPGVVECQRGDLIRKIFILNGDIIFATSNDLADSLGDFLLRAGRISQEQYDESVVRLKAEKKRQGVVLVEMGVLTPKSLFENVIEQVQEIVWDTFNWNDGEVSFRVGKYKDDELIKLNIPTRSAILRGVRDVKDARRLVARLGGATTIYTPCFTPEDLIDLNLDSSEAQLLQSVSGKVALKELTEGGPESPATNAKLLYAFSCLRLITRKKAITVQVGTVGGQMNRSE